VSNLVVYSLELVNDEWSGWIIFVVDKGLIKVN